MQNQLQYSANFTHMPSPQMSSPKFATQQHIKTFDKSLPTSGVKHYASNPNLSLEFNHPRPSSGMPSESNPHNHYQLNKNIEIRNPINTVNYPYNNGSTQGSSRLGRNNDMTKSLIVGESQRMEIPEEMTANKKEMFRNVPKRAYRMSETIEDMPQSLFSPRKDDSGFQYSKDTNNFYKNKQIEREVKIEEKAKDQFKQVPEFIRRQNDMKRSLVLEPTFENKFSQLQMNRQLSKTQKKKVTVDDFVKIKELGSGKYGRVYLVKDKNSNFICALKVIEKKLLHEQEITDQFIREVKIQMFLNHPNIIKMYGCFDDPVNIYILLEVGTGGQLYHQLKKSQPLSEPRIAFIMKQVCDAVNEIHSLKIIHRDIKPQNIVLHDNIIKLCDFGWSVHQDNNLRTTFCGTPLYVCPEILKGRQYDEKIDIWSIGIMMYEMVVGENPFKITREEELIKIVKDEIKIPSYLFVSAEVRDFLDRCLQKNPGDRASIKQLVNHAFFKKHQDKGKQAKLINM